MSPDPIGSRGFKGRFAAFQWETYYHYSDAPGDLGDLIEGFLSKFNDSEQIAWNSAERLKSFINALPGTRKHLAAHSMGNIVASEAIRLGATVENYALMQAAVPSAAYDGNERTRQVVPQVHQPTFFGHNLPPVTVWDKETPDDDLDPATRALAYRGRFENLGAQSNLVSFFLPEDYATKMPWEINNDQTKPEDAAFAKLYRYNRGNPASQKLYKYRVDTDGQYAYETVEYFLSPQTEYEAMAHACSTWGKAQGAQDFAIGAIGKNVALNSTRFQLPDQPHFYGFYDQHSGQFTARIQNLKEFYNEVLRAFDIVRNP